MKLSQKEQPSNTKTVLVTGGCGFIGVNVVKYLLDRNFKIRILDDLSTGNKDNLSDAGLKLPQDDLLNGDIRDQDIVIQAVKGVDAVIHLAAHTRVVESMAKPQENWDINTRGTANLLEACRISGVKTFIFASSNVALGQQIPPVDETKMPKPISPYGASKLACEALCTAYYYSFGLNTVSLRFGNCYGPFSRHKTSVIAKFIKNALQDEPLVIYGDGNQTRDFVHVADVCRAIHLCITTSNQISGEVFQIASGKETTVNELVKAIIGVSGKNLKIIYKPRQKGEIERNYSNITKANKMLGYKPEIKLEDGLRNLWEWYAGLN
jgi:UDP-glucose 4-epimerase